MWQGWNGNETVIHRAGGVLIFQIILSYKTNLWINPACNTTAGKLNCLYPKHQVWNFYFQCLEWIVTFPSFGFGSIITFLLPCIKLNVKSYIGLSYSIGIQNKIRILISIALRKKKIIHTACSCIALYIYELINWSIYLHNMFYLVCNCLVELMCNIAQSPQHVKLNTFMIYTMVSLYWHTLKVYTSVKVVSFVLLSVTELFLWHLVRSKDIWLYFHVQNHSSLHLFLPCSNFDCHILNKNLRLTIAST